MAIRGRSPITRAGPSPRTAASGSEAVCAPGCAGNPPEMAQIPGTELDVFGLCLGGNVFGWTADEEASEAVLDAYAAAGGHFIDTADVYMRPHPGISESIIGRWMQQRGNRAEMVIATKVGSDGGTSRHNILAHAEQS